jgi:hypothetical protein
MYELFTGESAFRGIPKAMLGYEVVRLNKRPGEPRGGGPRARAGRGPEGGLPRTGRALEGGRPRPSVLLPLNR